MLYKIVGFPRDSRLLSSGLLGDTEPYWSVSEINNQLY